MLDLYLLKVAEDILDEDARRLLGAESWPFYPRTQTEREELARRLFSEAGPWRVGETPWKDSYYHLIGGLLGGGALPAAAAIYWKKPSLLALAPVGFVGGLLGGHVLDRALHPELVAQEEEAYYKGPYDIKARERLLAMKPVVRAEDWPAIGAHFLAASKGDVRKAARKLRKFMKKLYMKPVEE